MKQKVKKPIQTKAKKRASLISKKGLALVHTGRPGLRHFKLIEHKYTGKLVHHSHTSHAALALVLVFLGFFMYASGSFVRAETQSESILVGAIVTGPPPTVGATITSPKNESELIGDAITDISGTCENDSFVVIRDNGLTVGSINCSSEGKFNLEVQLQLGKNTLSALNYDNMNQPGPVTPKVVVYLSEKNDDTSVDNIETEEVIPVGLIQAIPDNPSIITGVSKLSDCAEYNPGELPTGGKPHISIVCVPRLFFPGMQHYVGLVIWGGEPPYAISVDWGKGAAVEPNSEGSTLLSFSSPGYKLVKFNYAFPDTYRVVVKMKDSKGEEALIQTAIQVNGEKKTTTTTIVNDVVSGSWFKTPVPFYLIAVAITLGFWGGDLFDRRFGAKKTHSKKRRAA